MNKEELIRTLAAHAADAVVLLEKIVGNHRKCPAGAAPSKRYLFWRFLHAPLGKKDYSELWFDILSEIGNLYRWRGLKQLVAPKAKTISSCL